ncbi:hypothetical protein HK100_003947 [Physocladia obscura]|uniref:Uncharacterized protein n=1 Tax=Physocladia obscura TaxID=109957 RepID=A0AAD5XGU7_9FUNG|nr:hypothetical protein HK100_003947 [Physocladia obscura]
MAAHLPALIPPPKQLQQQQQSKHRNRRQVFLISDELRADATPIIHHFLAQSTTTAAAATASLRKEQTTPQPQTIHTRSVLVSLARPVSTYTSTARKLGYLLSESQNQNSVFAFIDAVPLLLNMSSAFPITPSSSSVSPLDSLFAAIKAAATPTITTAIPSTTRLTITIDNLSSLVSLGILVTDVTLFFLNTRRLLHSFAPTSRLVVLVHADIATPDDLFLLSYVKEHADYHVSVRGLDSGYTDHATGQICIESGMAIRSAGIGGGTVFRGTGDEESDGESDNDNDNGGGGADSLDITSNNLLYHVSESGAVKIWVPGNLA